MPTISEWASGTLTNCAAALFSCLCPVLLLLHRGVSGAGPDRTLSTYFRKSGSLTVMIKRSFESGFCRSGSPEVTASASSSSADTGRLPSAPARMPRVPPDLVADVRSDHAGETGAVFIYRGILSISGDQDLRRFAREHLQAEQHHLSLMDALLPAAQRSRLLPVWRISGWLTGALPAIFGPRAVYRTIDAVETFVDQHYAEQTAKLRDRPAAAELCALLEVCRLDEVAHRDDVRSRVHSAPGRVARWWVSAVAHGSRLGVAMARRY